MNREFVNVLESVSKKVDNPAQKCITLYNQGYLEMLIRKKKQFLMKGNSNNWILVT